MPPLGATPALAGITGERGATPGRHITRALNRRLGWLLRANRLLAKDGRWAQGKRFATAFGAGGKASGGESQISRWETGAVRPPHQALARYEEILGLVPGVLTSAADTAIRYAAAPGDSGGLLARPGLPGVALDELIDRALSTAVMSGPQWDRLTSAIVSQPELLIAPRASRSAIGERLLSEMIIAHGVPWQQRFESLNRLLNHPVFGHTVIEACASLGADPANQVFIETIGVLDGTSHPEASRRVLAQLIEPTNERALRGALLACVRKSQFRHFTPGQVEAVWLRLRELRPDPALRYEIEAVSAAVRRGYRGLDLGESARGDLTPDGGSASGSLLVTEANGIAHSSTSGLGRELPSSVDDLYHELVLEMLCHAESDTRLYTAMLLAASPYRQSLAAALARRLAAPGMISTELRLRIVNALRVLGGQPERPEVERLAVAETAPTVVSRTAAFTIGHLSGTSTTAFWHAAMSHHTRRWRQGRGAETAAALSGLVYSLGVAGQRRMLSAVRDDPTSPLPARAAATWWLNLPEHVYASAST